MKKEQERILLLQKEVKKHDELYEMNQPIITDTEYDDLYFELLGLEAKYPNMRKDSPTQKIVTIFVDTLNKVKHTHPILSLKKEKTDDGVLKFVNRLKGEFILQEKLDGLTLVLVYEKGRLISSVTRGDGSIGEEVIHNVKAIKNVPKRIKEKKRMVLRAEGIMPYEAFEKANTDGEYSSPRNLVSGTIRQLNSEVTANRDLEVIITEVVEFESDFTTDTEQLNYVKSLGFDVVPTFTFDTKNGSSDLLSKINDYALRIRPTLRYMIDGLVIKTNDLAIRKKEGFTNKYPKWAISYKFVSENAITTVKDIIVQVGKMGTLTPVAIFDPILIGGASIERATLHNFILLDSRDIRIGDKILVERSNDVIPKVVKAFHEQRTENLPKFETPKVCPVCSSYVAFEDDNASLICQNDSCDGKVLGKLQHFVSRKAMNIDGLGDKTVETLYNEGLLTSIKDIYSLSEHKEKIISLEGFGEGSFNKMVKAIEKSKEIPFEQVLYALAIKDVGESASRDIVNKLKSLDKMIDLFKKGELEKEVLSIDGIGKKITASLINALTVNMSLFDVIKELDLQTANEEKELGESTYNLTGLTICLTGSFKDKDRSAWKKEFESYGAKVSSSVSKKTNFLVMGDGTEGKSKHLSAIELNIPIVRENEIQSIILK